MNRRAPIIINGAESRGPVFSCRNFFWCESAGSSPRHSIIPFRIKEMDFADKWAAFAWMYKKQLGRRNLTDEQKTYMIGKMYEARKNTQGGDHGNQYTKVANGQNVHLPTRREIKDGTSGEIGKEFGINGRRCFAQRIFGGGGAEIGRSTHGKPIHKNGIGPVGSNSKYTA